jgi:hypothetical protein
MNTASWFPSPSSLNFLAGLFAGAGINMLTSVSTGPPNIPPATKLFLDSALWVIAAGFLTWAARALENAERDADLYINRDFTEKEKREIRHEYVKAAIPRALPAFTLTLVSVVAAILLLPGLIQWHAVLAQLH